MTKYLQHPIEIHELEKIIKNHPSRVYSWILMSSYLYYIEGRQLIPDSMFDALWKYMVTIYSTVDHYHKHLIQEDSLSSGSLFYLKESDYPTIVKNTAMRLYKGDWP